MDRRLFIQKLATVAVALTASGIALPSIARQAAEPGSFSTLSRVEVLVLGAKEKPYVLTFESSRPQFVPGADMPLAVSFSEHDADKVKMTLYRPQEDGSLKQIDYSYAGKSSTQHLDSFGVTLQVDAR